MADNRRDILARRAKFVAAALATVATAGSACGGKAVIDGEGSGAQTGSGGATAQPCLTSAGGAGAQACLEAPGGFGGVGGVGGGVGASVCLGMPAGGDDS